MSAILSNWDIFLFGLIFLLYIIAWIINKNPVHIEFSRDAINACITATSILLSASIAIIVFGIEKNLTGNIQILLDNLVIASHCFLISLVVGILNIARFPTVALKEDKKSFDFWTPIFGILQLLILFLGAIRLIRGIKIS